MCSDRSSSCRASVAASGSGQAVDLTADTGYFWFFNPANIEVIVKLLDGCTVNNRFWVFAGGLTNVNTSITVTDTTTGASRTYTNPAGTPFQPIQDTGAFATCPSIESTTPGAKETQRTTETRERDGWPIHPSSGTLEEPAGPQFWQLEPVADGAIFSLAAAGSASPPGLRPGSPAPPARGR